MQFPVCPGLTTVPIVHAPHTEHDRHRWTTLHRNQPTPLYLSIGVKLFKQTEPLLLMGLT